MTATLRIPAHTRRKPEDPYADIKAAKTQQLREEVALAEMARKIEAINEKDLQDA